MKKPKAKKGTPRRSAAAGTPAPLDPHRVMRMALEAAEMVAWEWDLRTHRIRYSDNVSGIAHGTAIEPYCSVDGLVKSVHPEDRDRLRSVIDRTCAGECAYECEYRVRMLDGEYHWILGKGRLTIVEGKRPAMIVGVSQDITARKRTEAELQGRTRQLAELAAALTLAEHRERRRLADLLHDDVQQLLVAARMQVHALAAGARGPRRRKAETLNRTLAETLALTRSITGSLAPPVLPHKDPASAFIWLASMMRTRHGLPVAVQVKRDLADAPEASVLLLFGAARELLMNVVKHAGARSARMSLRRLDGRLLLEVRDGGRGFTPETIPPPGDKAGFGLFSIRERAELLGGSLSVDSTPGRGTRVVLALPLPARPRAPERLARPAPRAAPPRRGATRARSPRGKRGRPVRIVLADNHRTVREGLRRMLEAQGRCLVVAEADDGEQAIECVRRHSPDAVVMDIRMPGMDGIEATRAIAKRWPEVKVIGLSMFDADSPLAAHLRRAGATSYVSKSAPAQELMRILGVIGVGPRYRSSPVDVTPKKGSKKALRRRFGA